MDEASLEEAVRASRDCGGAERRPADSAGLSLELVVHNGAAAHVRPIPSLIRSSLSACRARLSHTRLASRSPLFQATTLCRRFFLLLLLSQVVTGLPAAVRKLEQHLREGVGAQGRPDKDTHQRVCARFLPVGAPFHSTRLLGQVVDRVACDTAHLPRLLAKSGTMPLISCVDGSDLSQARR